MNEFYLTQDGDSNEYYILIPLKIRDREKAIVKSNEILNDLLSCISFTKRNFEKFHLKSPQFLKSIKRIEKTLWKILK